MDIVKMWLWIGIWIILLVICNGWILVACRRLGKPVPKFIKWGWIFGAIAVVTVVAHAIADSLK